MPFKHSIGWNRAYNVQKVLVVRKILNLNFRTILDIGSSCGIGKIPSFSLENLQTGHKSLHIHIDIDRSMLLKSKDSHCHSDFILADATNLPLRDETAELVFASEILEHLDEAEKSLDEWYRVLKKNGYMIITTPNTSMSWRDLYMKFFRQRDFVGHISEYDMRDLQNSLQKRTLLVESIMGFNLVLVGPLRLVIVCLRRLFDITSDKVSIKFNEIMCRFGRNYPLFSDSVLILCHKQ